MSFDWLLKPFKSLAHSFSNISNNVKGFYDDVVNPVVKDITGQSSNEDIAYANIAQNDKQFKQELAWQKQNSAQQMDFANRQLLYQTGIANKNFQLAQDTYNFNKESFEKNFAYQQQLNQTQMEREDTAYQRAMSDARAAGLSPLSVAGGASSSALSSAGSASLNPAQYDASGISSASGQYLDFARQYATLHSQLTSKSADVRSGAQLALMQMNNQARLSGQSLALQAFNSAVNFRKSFLENDLMKENIQTKKYENDWYAKHGYQRMTVAQVLSDLFNRDSTKKLISDVSAGYDKVAGALDKIASSIPNQAKVDFNFNDTFKEFKEQGLSDSDAKIMTDNVEQMVNEWNNMSWSEKMKTSFSSFMNEAKLKLKDLINK